MELGNNELNKTQETAYQPYNGILSNGDFYCINDISRVNGATHKKESLKTDIYIATISDSDSKTKNYIGFELEESQPITSEYFNAIAENYSIKKGFDSCTYIGVLAKNSENKIEPIFNSKVSKTFLDQYTEYLIAHPPKLPPKFVNRNKSIDDYDGIDNNGNAFKIRNVSKVCKDANKTYLYTSDYIDNEEKSFSIAFETDIRLQDIVEYKEEHEIKGIIDLLTISSNGLSNHSLNYIGKLNYDGKIEKNIKHSSKKLSHTLKKLQKEYEK